MRAMGIMERVATDEYKLRNTKIARIPAQTKVMIRFMVTKFGLPHTSLGTYFRA
jgi:hypothetical protein